MDPYDSDVWLGNFTQTLFNSQEWKDNDTMLIVTWSGANGMYDHVPPYAGDRFGPGIRVPTIIASPFHTGGAINSNPYEHLSIMKMIQRRFNLPMSTNGVNPIMTAARDTATRDLSNSFYEAGAGNPSTVASSSGTTTSSTSSSTGSNSGTGINTSGATQPAGVSVLTLLVALMVVMAAVL